MNSATSSVEIAPQTAPLARFARNNARLTLARGVASGVTQLALSAGQLAYNASISITGAAWGPAAAAQPVQRRSTRIAAAMLKMDTMTVVSNKRAVIAFTVVRMRRSERPRRAAPLERW